jgi:hypothetical protein
MGKNGLDPFDLGQGTAVGSVGHVNELSGCIKCGESHEFLRNH